MKLCKTIAVFLGLKLLEIVSVLSVISILIFLIHLIMVVVLYYPNISDWWIWLVLDVILKIAGILMFLGATFGILYIWFSDNWKWAKDIVDK